MAAKTAGGPPAAHEAQGLLSSPEMPTVATMPMALDTQAPHSPILASPASPKPSGGPPPPPPPPPAHAEDDCVVIQGTPKSGPVLRPPSKAASSLEPPSPHEPLAPTHENLSVLQQQGSIRHSLNGPIRRASGISAERASERLSVAPLQDVESSAGGDSVFERLACDSFGQFDTEERNRGATSPFFPRYNFSAPTVGHVPPMFTGICDRQQRNRFLFHMANVGRIVFASGTIFTVILAELCTWLCLFFGTEVNIHPNIFLTVLVFPLAFSINAVYQRRERALDDLAILKSSGVAWFYLHQEWAGKLCDPRIADLPPKVIKRNKQKLKRHNQEYGKWHLQHTYNSLQTLYHSIRMYLQTTDTDYKTLGDTRAGQVYGRNAMLRKVSDAFKEVSFANERLRIASIAASQQKSTLASEFPVQAPILTRPIHWTFFMLQAWEKMRGIREYRSPTTIRSFTKTLTVVVPSFLAPYFAYVGRTNQTWAAYVGCAFVSIALSALRLIQDYGENPFIPVGNQDIDNLNLSELDIDWNPQVQMPTDNPPPPMPVSSAPYA